jgi:hypothetical protein
MSSQTHKEKIFEIIQNFEWKFSNLKNFPIKDLDTIDQQLENEKLDLFWIKFKMFEILEKKEHFETLKKKFQDKISQLNSEKELLFKKKRGSTISILFLVFSCVLLFACLYFKKNFICQ